jgi:hypothetical protein
VRDKEIYMKIVQKFIAANILSIIISLILTGCLKEVPENPPKQNKSGFTFEHNLMLPGSTEEIYDAVTGDISGWWDHSFSENPLKFYIDPKPGGGFYEIFNESGDGVLHATVIFAERGKMLRMDGPLGLSGQAVTLVITYTFEQADPEITKLSLTVNGSGEIEEATSEVVKKVWHHFLFDQLKPYVESGKHKITE